MLKKFITFNREEIISSAIDRTAGQHGRDLLVRGLTVSQVVHDYGDVCQTITQEADMHLQHGPTHPPQPQPPSAPVPPSPLPGPTSPPPRPPLEPRR